MSRFLKGKFTFGLEKTAARIFEKATPFSKFGRIRFNTCPKSFL